MLLLLGCASLSRSAAPGATPALAQAAAPDAVPDAVLLDDVADLRAGTPLVPVAATNTTTSYGEEIPVTRRVRVAGAELDLPARVVALREGEPLRGDLDGDGALDRVWRAASLARGAEGDDVYPRERREVVVAEVNGGLLIGGERVGGGCSGEGLDTVTLADATGDGRLDVVVTAFSYVCEAGYDAAIWDVLRPGASELETIGSVSVPRYPLVGRVNVGHVWWWPGGARAVVIEPSPDPTGPDREGALDRTERRWTWTKEALVPTPTVTGPVRATLDGAAVVVTTANAGDDRATLTGDMGARTVPRASLRFADPFFEAELDGGADPAVDALPAAPP